MSDEATYTIGELAEAAGVSRRAVRYYVQRGLLPPPLGLGRGRHYTTLHLLRLLAVKAQQAAGASLDDIAGRDAAQTPLGAASAAPEGSAPQPEAWLRVPLGPGLELALSLRRGWPEPEQLRRLSAAAFAILGPPPGPEPKEETP